MIVDQIPDQETANRLLSERTRKCCLGFEEFDSFALKRQRRALPRSYRALERMFHDFSKACEERKFNTEEARERFVSQFLFGLRDWRALLAKYFELPAPRYDALFNPIAQRIERYERRIIESKVPPDHLLTNYALFALVAIELNRVLAPRLRYECKKASRSFARSRTVGRTKLTWTYYIFDHHYIRIADWESQCPELPMNPKRADTRLFFSVARQAIMFYWLHFPKKEQEVFKDYADHIKGGKEKLALQRDYVLRKFRQTLSSILIASPQ
jgi:hypothetical protein